MNTPPNPGHQADGYAPAYAPSRCAAAIGTLMESSYLPRTESEVKFETYRYYLECFREYLRQEHSDWQAFARKVLKHTQRVQPLKDFDISWLERFLKIAWNTEYLLSVGSGDTELLRINNQWAPIQCYYAVYAGAEAMSHVIDGGKADGHKKALQKCTGYFVQKGLAPWNMAFRGPLGKRRHEQRPVNFPDDLSVPHNLQRRGVQPLEMIAKCLKAEHANRVDDEWSRSKGLKYCFDPGYTGLLHFLYRLRIKSNYKEVDLFVSRAPEDKVKSFSGAIKFLCFCNLLYMEIIIMRRCRKGSLQRIAEKYLALNQRADRLQKRLAFYDAEL